MAPEPVRVGPAVQQEDGRTAPAVFDLEPDPVHVDAHGVHRSNDGEQLLAGRSGWRFRFAEGEHLVEDAAGQENTSTPRVEHRGHADRTPAAGRDRLAAPPRSACAELPRRVVGLVRHAGDLGVDLGQPVTVEVEGVGHPRAELRLGRVVPPPGQRDRSRRCRRSRSTSRRHTAWSRAKDAPRPTDGFVHAHASPTAATPVATGSPSTTKWRTRSSIFAITSTPVIGSASTQWAISG